MKVETKVSNKYGEYCIIEDKWTTHGTIYRYWVGCDTFIDEPEGIVVCTSCEQRRVNNIEKDERLGRRDSARWNRRMKRKKAAYYHRDAIDSAKWFIIGIVFFSAISYVLGWW